MRSLLLLSALLVAVTAQKPPHMLYTPQSYYVGTDTTFSLTTYSSETFEVTLRITYQQCSCTQRNQRRIETCTTDTVYAEDTQTTSALGSQATTLRVKLPSLSELTSRRYYISIMSSEHTFLSRRQIYFSGNQFGSVLVKTDKPIYKPSQTVNICVVFLGATLRPHNADATAEVSIRDATRRQILKTRVVIPAGEGVGCLDIQLSDEPNLGSWSASANILSEVGSNQCQFYFSHPRSSCSFKVDEFVLPRFEVTVDGPKQITRNLDRIRGTVDATYTFGEKVQGTVRVNATLTSSRRRESILFSDITAPLVDGKYEIDIDTDEYRRKVRYRYDPFCVRSSVRIVAEVTESGRNTKQSDSIVVPLVSNPLTISFDDDMPGIFRPGLPYTINGQASRADGSPAGGELVQVTATANNGRDVLVDKEILTDRSGKLSETLDVPRDANCLKFTMSPVLSEKSCDRQVVCFSPSPMFSPTDSYLQLTHTSSSGGLSPGSKTVVKAEATFKFETLHLLVIGQGNLLLHQALVPSNRAGGVRSMMVQVPITHEGVPRVKILAVVAREDGELVADLIEIQVACELEHEVRVSFGKDEASPGDEVSITTDADPGSVVVLGVIDKSLTLLADACKSVDNDNVCGLLRRLTGGNKITSDTCSTESESACCPLTCNEPRKRAASDIFSAAGINLDTNMFRPFPPSPPSRPGPFPFPPSRFPEFEFDGDSDADGPAESFRPAVPTLDDSAEPPAEDEESADVRDFFPETWIWEILETNKEGVAVFPSVVPDTITTWNAEAFAINRDSGLGISPVTQLTVKKELFVSLELPFSINFQETVTVTPLVFYFGSNDSVTVRVTVTVDDELELLSSELVGEGFVQVEKGTGTPFDLKLKPRAIGRLPITICVRDARSGLSGPCIDAVKKELFVKPGCEKFQLTTNVYAEESGNQCFNFTLPSCVIPGSAKASISVTGDLISPPDLDNLLVLPYGCGEQNMVRFSLNLVTTNYLKATDQLPEVLLPKIRVNLNTGYQRQLTYLQGQGCFGIWSRGQCSLWLTAFTARFLIEASEPALASCLNFPEGSELVDPTVITGAINYLVRQQEKSGRFPVIGRLHNYHLLRRDNFIGLTAYVLITLRQAPPSSSVRNAIVKAEQYIVNASTDSFCNYGLAVATTALAIGDNSSLESDRDEMVAELKRRIQSSRVYPGACFLCNACPDDQETTSSSDAESCSSRPRREGSSSCVETTAYALRALLAVEDREKTVCLAQWLTQVKSASGGFYSSQDTLVALEALSLFAEETFTSELNKAVTVSVPGMPAITHTITPANRYERRDFEVANVPSTDSCVTYSGSGTAIVQSTLEYYGCNCCDDARVFSLSLATKISGVDLMLSISVRYLEEGSSNMVIVDVEIPSGYVFAGYRDELDVIQRQDTRGANAIFYINEIRDEVVFTVSFFESFPVEDHQQLPVTVYDYYEPDQIVTRYFLPVNSGTLATPTRRPPVLTSSPLPVTGTPPPRGDGEEGEEDEE